jgi:hypothetical protein
MGGPLQRRFEMRALIMTTLVSTLALGMLAGATNAGGRNGGMDGSSGINGGFNNNNSRSTEEKQRILDLSTTGSIKKCDSKKWDSVGRCGKAM